MLGLFYCLGRPGPWREWWRGAWPLPSRLGRVAELGALPSYIPAPLMGIALYELSEEVLRFVQVQVNDLHAVLEHQVQSVPFLKILRRRPWLCRTGRWLRRTCCTA